ncbi:hypothetical protein [Streptomyces sp. MMBL 11-1]|uniref:hypothetical protein n=1 Tax=Streptomyces sp. MMBL 11-1 TaxID=3026420 RepID=UPI00235EEB16|nr:hypothetical protein [Streptomyces sp. MMBL 11-1]
MTMPAPEALPTPLPLPIRTVVADWETVSDDQGSTISPDMRPVVITVTADSSDAAIDAASDKLQARYGPHVEALHRQLLTRDDWFGLNDTDPLLRVCAVFVGAPILDDDGDEHAVYLA